MVDQARCRKNWRALLPATQLFQTADGSRSSAFFATDAGRHRDRQVRIFGQPRAALRKGGQPVRPCNSRAWNFRPHSTDQDRLAGLLKCWGFISYARLWRARWANGRPSGMGGSYPRVGVRACAPDAPCLHSARGPIARRGLRPWHVAVQRSSEPSCERRHFGSPLSAQVACVNQRPGVCPGIG